MLRGFYTAASGMWSQEKRLNNIANNIANVSTVAYKSENLVLGTFGEHLTIRRNAYQNTGYQPIGDGVYMQIVDDKYTNFEQGGFLQTTRPLDMSIMGEGYFVIATDAGEELLTRDGQFSLDEEGYLVLPGYGRVQGENGDIALTTSQIIVDRPGNIFVQDEDGELEQIDRFIVALPEEDAIATKVAERHFIVGDYTEATEENPPTIRQYHLERSNANLSDEMTNMIASQRSLQSCSQIVKMYDEMAEQINTRISRI